MGEIKINVMPNLFRHLIKSKICETLKQVQGDKISITTQSPSWRKIISGLFRSTV